MPIAINCISYAHTGKCLHQAAPRRMLGAARCILWTQSVARSTDPREPTGCRLCESLRKPAPPPQRP